MRHWPCGRAARSSQAAASPAAPAPTTRISGPLGCASLLRAPGESIIEQSKGETDHFENLQLLCGSCN
ncbi:MAG: hypothetical protein F4W90_01775, partial [Gammaproteobacteria bacterium]|nr:hypothetical protein [Gammaproteobacteria bacterium]